MIKITGVMSEEACYKKLRELKYPNGDLFCPGCLSSDCRETRKATPNAPNQQYCCKQCGGHFNDLTGPIFQSGNLPLTSWICCLYLMGLNKSNRQISQELGVSEKTAQNMTDKLRKEVEQNKPKPPLSGEVEFDDCLLYTSPSPRDA